jgi:hypothetical protein
MSASEKWPIGKKGVPTYSMENKIHSTESGSAPTTPITSAPRKKPTPLASGCPNAQPAQVPSKTPFAPPHNPDTRLPESPSPSPKTPAALKAPSNKLASYSKHTTPIIRLQAILSRNQPRPHRIQVNVVQNRPIGIRMPHGPTCAR